MSLTELSKMGLKKIQKFLRLRYNKEYIWWIKYFWYFYKRWKETCILKNNDKR